MVKRQFTKQFKEDALSYVHDHSDLSVNACAKNLGISPVSYTHLPVFYEVIVMKIDLAKANG